MTYLFRRNLRELDMVVEELWQELQESKFEPEGFEVRFEGGADLPPIPIPNRSMAAVLRGVIDRVDIWKQEQGGGYYRVVDYKTGRKTFDYCDVFNGVGLQMLLYMFALQESGSELLKDASTPAGVLYFPARAAYIGVDGQSDKEAEKKRRSEWKRKGLLLEDQEVLQAMEPNVPTQRMCFTVNKTSGAVSGDLASREQLKMLEGYVFHILSKLVEDIASGNVEPNPYTRGSSHNACTFCPYGSVCHSASVEGRRDYAGMKSPEFWKEIEKEMKNHGG